MRGASKPPEAQAWTWAHAVSSTHSPIGMIRPVSSARGMNWAGETMPSSGCCQRTRASKPTSSRLSMSTLGW